MSEKQAYWAGWNDAMLGKWRPQECPRELRIDYRAGWLKYHEDNG